jgi:hypothetical protein
VLLLRTPFYRRRRGARFGVLDIPGARLFSESAPDPALLPLLQSGAIAFSTI